MANKLTVIKPFHVMEQGDTFELTDKGTYVSNYEENYNEYTCGDDMISSYKSSMELSENFANYLVKEGYLKSVSETESKFVNVFDEIDKLIDTYSRELSDLNENCNELPACMKVEKETVLANMMKVLSHLNSLKK